MKNVGFVMNSIFGAITLAFLTKRGIDKLKERVLTRALVAKENTNAEKSKED